MLANEHPLTEVTAVICKLRYVLKRSELYTTKLQIYMVLYVCNRQTQQIMNIFHVSCSIYSAIFNFIHLHPGLLNSD
jgi:hypothetical protein